MYQNTTTNSLQNNIKTDMKKKNSPKIINNLISLKKNLTTTSFFLLFNC